MEHLNLDNRTIDVSLVGLANIINVLIVAIFLSRAGRKEDLEYYLGLAMVTLALPVLFIAVRNASTGREWWTAVLPILMVAFLCLELALDYVFKIKFRNTVYLWPYLVMFYLALMGLIGYAFLTSRLLGYVTLCTYFLGLLAAWYSYSKVGHG